MMSRMKLAVSLGASAVALFVSISAPAAEENEAASEPELRATFGIVRVGTLTGGSQGGAQLSMTFGSPSLSFTSDLRAADDSINDVIDGFTLGRVEPDPELSLGFASASAGARHNFDDGNFSPFVGGGIAVETMSLRDADAVQRRAGLAGYAEVGLDVLRRTALGSTIGLRIDVPTFAVRSYTPIVAAAFALRL